jgi:hypothetical protein
MLFGFAAAFAAEPDVFLGGGADLRGGWSDGAPVLQTQAEFDARVGFKAVSARLDADVTFDALTGELVLTPPEWAMVQVRVDDPSKKVGWATRFGVLNPNIGLEDWDMRNNYLPSYSIMWDAAQPGRVLGAEAEVRVGDGHHLMVWGGLDLDWGSLTAPTPDVGVGFWSEQDTWGSWSGFFSLPTLDLHALVTTFEFYPHDLVSLTLDTSAGLSGGRGFVGGEVVLNVAPEFVVTPVARGEFVVDPQDAALGGVAEGVPDGTASLGLRAAPIPQLQLMVEGKATFADGRASPGVWAGVQLFAPDPPTYDVIEPVEDDVPPAPTPEAEAVEPTPPPSIPEAPPEGASL